MTGIAPIATDLNADTGEAATPEHRAAEDAVIASVTSVNIACGGHAGDEATMRHSVRLAAQHGVAVGVHPSYPDRSNFGRVRIDIDPETLCSSIAAQIAALAAVARSEGVRLTHCKPHGALYHAASTDESVASAIFRAAQRHDPSLRLIGQAGSRTISWWRAWDAVVAEEAFADRVYERDGSLRSRSEPHALITDPDAAAAQAVSIATTRTVRCADGSTIPLTADTLCVHADTPNAGAIAARVAQALRAAGVTLRPLA